MALSPNKPCNPNDKLPAQTLFLGASVASFTNNIGWGTQPSQLTVNLIEDTTVASCFAPGSQTVYTQFDSPSSYKDNHYHNCLGLQCYIDKITGKAATDNTPVENLIIPGKVYYTATPEFGIVSKYLTKPDPGFFGYKTRMNIDCTYDNIRDDYKYDIIDTPVYFKMGNFQFGGFVQSWNRNIGQNGTQFTVIINGPQSLLNSSYIITDQYAGSVFSSQFRADYGVPSNYLEDFVPINQNLSNGALPNVFNIYGFAESLGINYFGTSGINEDGMSINTILESLMILTSVTHDSSFNLISQPFPNKTNKKLFSTFGRLISKCMMQESPSPYTKINERFNGYGVIAPQSIIQFTDKFCQFVLDLNDVLYTDNNRTNKRFPDNVRIPGPVLTITDFLNFIGDKAGLDFDISIVPTRHSGQLYNVIKVKTISRLKQPPTNIIENTIKELQCQNYYISSNSIGKEKNDAPNRCLLIGGKQQRLCQVKSYRLAYSQNNFIYNPKTLQFVDYRKLNNNPYTHGKIKFPNFFSTRNTHINDYYNLNNPMTAVEKDIVTAMDTPFNSSDTIWASNTQLNDGIPTTYGNYNKAFAVPQSNDNSRWFPLYYDTICPFFGYVYDNKVGVSADNSNTDFRQIRPVWYDTWTAQIAIIIRISELPQLNVSLDRSSLESDLVNFTIPKVANLAAGTAYGNSGKTTTYSPVEYFILTESEIRAALAGFDNFLVYSLAKTYKPDLIELIRRAYFIQTRDNLILNGVSQKDAINIANKETDWYWKLLGANIAGDDLYPTLIHPDKTDGSQYIQEKALQDLKLIHKFILEVGKYYGKRYMVAMPHVRSYRENILGTNPVAFSTSAGYGYIFSGPPNDLKYNYIPTNDGAWEEYGNVIDDSIVVGGVHWLSLVDDVGKIKPILGFNNNYNYDYIRQAKCLAGKSNLVSEFVKEQANPYFSFSSWLTLYELRGRICSDSYIFPSLDLSSLSTTDYVLIDQYKTNSTTNAVGPVANLLFNTSVSSYDAWNKPLQIQIPGSLPQPLPRSKIYTTASVQEKFIYLDPVNLKFPRVLVDGPGLNLNVSSEENAKDPNRTVISNVAAEDLMIYLKTRLATDIDYSWVYYMLNYISPIVLPDENNPYFLGLYTVSSNHTANNVELAPKAAHPFFAGIPIKSNQFVYGPWTNYPYARYGDILVGGKNIDLSSDFPLTCSITNITPPSADQARIVIDNTINGVDIEINEDFVPWNYGGMLGLDTVAFGEIETKINYQSVIETAQIEILGLPIFNLGGRFDKANMNNILDYTGSTKEIVVTDSTYIPQLDGAINPVPVTAGALVYAPIIQASEQPAYRQLRYKIIDLKTIIPNVDSPIITAISTSVGPQGITTNYTFRTYTRKLGLFNKEQTDRIKRLNKINITRGKQISQIAQDISNFRNKEREALLQERLDNAQFGSSDLSSKLFGWSPSTVLIGQASPLIDEPLRSPKYIEDFALSSEPKLITGPSMPTKWIVPSTDDQGNTPETNARLTYDNSTTTLKHIGRITSTVQLFERKEVNNQLDKDYGMQSAMSLDGLLSPISFYPTFKNSTFSYGLHFVNNCPFCRGTKKRTITLAQYQSDGSRENKRIDIFCDKCGYAHEKLNAKLPSTNDDDESKPPVNLVTLNPIVVPYGEFRNSNTQNYVGVHPNKKHADITSSSDQGIFGGTRNFRDRLRHSIEIVARGSIPQNKMGYALETSRNFNANNIPGVADTNLDYSEYDIGLHQIRDKVRENPDINKLHANNQRFFGLRGPLTLHGWGYDDEGYPVPNAADEPLAYDKYGRPKRFKLLKEQEKTTKKYKSLKHGESFVIADPSNDTNIYAKTFNNEGIPRTVGDNTLVYKVTYKNDMKNPGGFDPAIYQGDIIGKTQQFKNNKWTAKEKLNEFYLNWAERPDLWRVGPVDLTWDSTRMVWVGGKGGCEEIMPPYIVTNSNDISTLTEFFDKKISKKCPYKMIYATLEEDLIKQPDFDETFATKAFIDDIEFSKQPLLQGYRRLIYIKDKCAYTAPMGTKLLCRYNRDTGFYEPVTKPSVVAKGKISSGSAAIIDLNYIQGRRSSVVPTKTITFDNPLGFSTPSNSIGIFTFIYGKWTLTSIKQ